MRIAIEKKHNKDASVDSRCEGIGYHKIHQYRYYVTPNNTENATELFDPECDGDCHLWVNVKPLPEISTQRYSHEQQ